MATAQGMYQCSLGSLAAFKNWSMAISGAFSAFGWIQTSDTGQVNWSTIVSVPGNNAFVYEVWKANDAQASTTPIFIKMEYGNTNFGNVTYRITYGTGSDGAGNITHPQLNWPWTSTAPNDQGATLFQCYFSGDAGEFRMYMWQHGSVNIAQMFGIERSKDNTGAKSTDYFTGLYICDSNYIAKQQSTYTGGNTGNYHSGIITITPTNYVGTGFSATPATTTAYPVFPDVGKTGNQMIGFMTVIAGDVAFGAIVTVSGVYGSSHTYVAFKGLGSNLGNSLGFRSTNGLNCVILMRYE